MAFQPSLFSTTLPTIGIVDLETSGFLHQKGLIVEIGIVSLDLNNGQIKEEFNSLVKEPGFGAVHTREPYGWIFSNSSLRIEDVEAAPTMKALHDTVQKILSSFDGITAYNAAFDLPFLRSRSFTFTAYPCPMIAAAPVVNLPPAEGHFEPKWPTVQEAWDFFFGDTGYMEQHRALDDAMHEAKILFELYKRRAYKLPRMKVKNQG